MSLQFGNFRRMHLSRCLSRAVVLPSHHTTAKGLFSDESVEIEEKSYDWNLGIFYDVKKVFNT